MRPPPPVRLLDRADMDPPRLLESDTGLSESARRLLLSPPPVKPLDAATAMRVRAAVLQMPGPVLPPAKHPTSAPPSTFAYLKLGAVAGSAALFGAGAMTLASGYLGPSTGDFGSAADRSGVVVVSGLEGLQNPASGSNGPRPAGLNGPHRPSSSPIEEGQGDGKSLAGAMRESVSTQAPEAQPGVGSPLDEAGQNSAKARREDGTRVDATSGLADRPSKPTVERGVGPADALAPVLSVNDLESISDEPGFGAGQTSNVRVRPAFRKIAGAPSQAAAARPGHASSRSSTSNSLEAETLLLEEARSKLGREPEAALALALEHQTRYRRGQLLEQRRMIHLEALLRLGRDEEALALAKTIGNSLYQARATALLAKYGI